MIYIESPTSTHEGFYQCLASNMFGTAVTVKALLRKASTRLALSHSTEGKGSKRHGSFPGFKRVSLENCQWPSSSSLEFKKVAVTVTARYRM